MNTYNNPNNLNYIPKPVFTRPTVKKHGKFRTVIIACLATLIFGGAVGVGGSQILLEIMAIESFPGGAEGSGGGGLNFPSDIDRSAWQGMPNQANTESPPISHPVSGEEFCAMTLFELRSDTVVGVKLVRETWSGEITTTNVIGSGVIFSDDGFIITNAHVIEGAIEVIVVVEDYDEPAVLHEFDAVVFGFDAPTDLAVLKIERDEPFRYAPLGSSSALKVGQSVAVIGNPVGMFKTMTKGIVSGLQRDLQENPLMLPSIQTDAPVNPGNSGGPLFNMYGEVVGIVNIKLISGGGGASLDNLGFAISIDEAIPIIEDLATHGRVTSRPMLGITAIPINDGTHAGLEVRSVIPGSPAAESGLSRNDIITHIEGEEVRTVADIQTILRNKNIGERVELTIIRYDNFGETRELTLVFALISANEA